jgi:hypothetical protein
VTAAYPNLDDRTTLFASADQFYNAIKDSIVGEFRQKQTGPEVERWLTEQGLELMRRLYQDFVTLRGLAQPLEPVVGTEGCTRTHRRHGSRKLKSVFGAVEVERTGYSGRGLSTLHPVDASLNLPRCLNSLELDRQIAMAAASMSFDEALEVLDRHLAADVPKRQEG